ncbi:unnamed protein product, partial [Sphenostylis stenocarpa]
EESLRQELGKQEGESRKGRGRGSPSLGRLCPGSGNLSYGWLVAMVRAGKHGSCISGWGRCSAFYLGSTLMYAPPHIEEGEPLP